MRLRIVHTTGYEYDGKAAASYNQARLSPQTTPEQIVVHHRLEVSPAPWTYDYRDYFGNQVTAFEVLDPHDALTVTATSTVQTNRPAPTTGVVTWEQLATREVADRWTEYLMPTELVSPGDDLLEEVRRIAAASPVPADAARAVCALAGSSPDAVHLALGGLRAIGIPCRYVTGYATRTPEVGETLEGSAHAWLEWWDQGWVGYDPVAGQHPDDGYVTVATGRDLADVRPLSGVYSGAATSTITSAVEITRLA